MFNNDNVGGVAQLARASALHAEGHRFDSVRLHQIVLYILLSIFLKWDKKLIRCDARSRIRNPNIFISIYFE